MTYETRRLLAEAEEETREKMPPDDDMSHCRSCDDPIDWCMCPYEDAGGWGVLGTWYG